GHDRTHHDRSRQARPGARRVLVEPGRQHRDAERDRACRRVRVQEIPRLRETAVAVETRSVPRETDVARVKPPRALDRLFALYLILSGAALLFPHRPAEWMLLGAVHILAVLLLLHAPPFDALAARVHSRAPRLATVVHDWYVLLLIPALYTELAVLNRSVWDGRYFDEAIIRLEALFFGGQPSQTLAAAVPDLWVSEPLHLAYLSYYLIIFGPPLVLYLRSRTKAFRATTFTLMLTFFAHYLFFVYFPV